MGFDLKTLIDQSQGTQWELLRDYINPKLARVLKMIGFDPVYVRGRGAHLWDDQGNDYLDMLAGYGVFNIGRAHPKIKDAIRQYLELDSPNLIKMGTQLLAGIFARKLIEEVAPEGLDTVFFCNSGTEAIEGAIKLSRCATGRPRLLYCDHAFHGLTMGSLSLNGGEEFREGFGALLPNCTRIPFGDIDALERELSRRDVAALVTEPIQGHGVFIPPEDYLPRARELCDRYGTLLVIDEVQTGLGRTGKMFACEHWNVTPDILTMSKALSGGFCPVGAILYKRQIYNKVYSSLDRCIVHSSTFGQNDLAAVCGMATLEVMREERIVENSAEIGAYLLSRLRKMKDRYGFIKEVRGKGLMIAIEFTEPRSTRPRMGWKLVHRLGHDIFCQSILMPLMIDHHILAQVAGHRLDVIKLIPPLVIGKKDADRFLGAFDQVLAAAYRFPGPIWEFGSRLAKAALS